MPASKFTPELGERIVAHVVKGLSVQRAGDAERVPYRTLKDWMARTDEPYAAFALSMRAARADRCTALLGKIEMFAENNKFKDAKVLMQLLANTFPEYGPRLNVRVEQEHDRLFAALEKRLSPEAFAIVLDVAESLGEEGDGLEGEARALPPASDPPG